LALLVYAYAPNALATNAMAKKATTAVEYSFITTVLAVGTKNACMATSLAGTVRSSVLVV